MSTLKDELIRKSLLHIPEHIKSFCDELVSGAINAVKEKCVFQYRQHIPLSIKSNQWDIILRYVKYTYGLDCRLDDSDQKQLESISRDISEHYFYQNLSNSMNSYNELKAELTSTKNRYKENSIHTTAIIIEW